MKRIFFVIITMLLPFKAIFCEYPHVKEASRLLLDEALILVTNYNFKVFGLGGGLLEKINSLELTIETPVCLNLNEARGVFTLILNDWIQRVNKDEKARSFFKNYPMTAENFELRIILGNFDTLSNKEEEKLALVFNDGDKFVYCYRDGETKSLEPLSSESYKDALKILNISKDNIKYSY